MDAVEKAPNNSDRRYIIYVKKGLYQENVQISASKSNLMLLGDGISNTIISGNRSNDGVHWDSTYDTATFAVIGNGFIAKDLTFENTAGPQMNQSVALLSESDHSVFFRCGIMGYQDTLYAHSNLQFYRDCRITGTVDFIFGDGTVVFQNCEIIARKGRPKQKNTITAHGRKELNETTGFSFQFCNISADLDLIASNYSNPTYLGRPWRRYSRTVFMQSYMSSVVSPKGWLEWEGQEDFNKTLFYAEYKNYGLGANLSLRVKWPGFHAINDDAQADIFTVSKFIHGNSWLPSTGVNYTGGLTA
ncbi:pectinesterase/pectinesterase inhibitor PPE8B-like [Macadamia integrifolia]|uniref:pectinesterase/pectinesterase inhibitor PPE8B-like n=1 Tax=Macadamia integrifolia TaxID=60698 RepID=UPI001C4FB7E4|nr:pectinesterase/pectinesterase inhibitor PPE8B-like [Macadamia integrifolia]